jgi:transcriptional regulator with XRE-family HTH domain
MCMGLHERLRTIRERRGLTLTSIARQHGVREQNLLLIERNAFEQLPTGIYGRHAVRSYAAAVGLCPDEALAEVLDRLRVPEDPMEGIARVRGLPRASRRDELVHRSHMPAVTTQAAGAWRQMAAAAIDGALLVAIDVMLLHLTARVAGVAAADVLRAGALPLIAVCAVIAALYFVLLGGIGRATIGTQLAHAPVEAGLLDGADVRAVMQRGWQYAMSESSSLVKWNRS